MTPATTSNAPRLIRLITGEDHIRPDGRLAHRIRELRGQYQDIWREVHGNMTEPALVAIEEVAVLRAAYEVSRSRYRAGLEIISSADMERLGAEAHRAEAALRLGGARPPTRPTRKERRRLEAMSSSSP